MSPLIRRSTILSLTMAYAVQLTGCTTWRPRTEPVPEVLATDERGKLRFTLSDSSRVELVQARLVADTLEGLSIRAFDTTIVRIPRERIAAVEVREANPGATVALVLGTTVAVAAAAGAVCLLACDLDFGIGLSAQ